MKRLLLVDCHDSFSYNLKDYLERVGATVDVVSVEEEPKANIPTNYDGIVLSPGPGRPSDFPELDSYLKLNSQIPLLGICLGCQTIGEYYGSSLMLTTRPMHGKISTVMGSSKSSYLAGLPKEFKVVRYHSIILAQVPLGFKLLLETDNKEIMGIEQGKTLGIQFHPEAWETEFGLQLLKNWVDML